jgi:hypothetical protein
MIEIKSGCAHARARSCDDGDVLVIEPFCRICGVGIVLDMGKDILMPRKDLSFQAEALEEPKEEPKPKYPECYLALQDIQET